MNIVVVWVLVYYTGVYGGYTATVTGDYATLLDCERVQKALDVNYSRCVQVSKVK